MNQPPSPTTIATIDLNRLLSRLDEKLNPPTSPPSNPLSSLERAKLVANLEHARYLLQTLERQLQPPQSRLTTQKSTLSTLDAQKQAIRRLNEQLHLSVSASPSEGEDETDDEVEITPTPQAAIPSEEDRKTTISSTLRHRFASPNRSQRAELFASRDAGEAGEEDAELELDSHRKEQESLTEDMLGLARALKESSVRFGVELEEEKGLLESAREGLDRNALGIEGAGRKMEDLRRNEKVGLLWSVLYPVIVVGLAFLTLFVLFFAPKLRWW